MNKKFALRLAAPFKAKLRHYHRSASPSLYERKQKRWEDVSPSELGDATIAGSQDNIGLAARLTPSEENTQSAEENTQLAEENTQLAEENTQLAGENREPEEKNTQSED